MNVTPNPANELGELVFVYRRPPFSDSWEWRGNYYLTRVPIMRFGMFAGHSWTPERLIDAIQTASNGLLYPTISIGLIDSRDDDTCLYVAGWREAEAKHIEQRDRLIAERTQYTADQAASERERRHQHYLKLKEEFGDA